LAKKWIEQQKKETKVENLCYQCVGETGHELSFYIGI
jgi:hypothetical protein